jgi:endoglucanase
MTGSIIGDTSDKTAATTAQFGAFWGELAGRFRDNEKVIFGLMNEPHDMKTSLVIQNNQAAIDAIRKAGANQLILAPGNSWTGGHSWTEGSDPSTQLTKLKDPQNNTGFDIHEYLDSDFSGGHAACAQSASKLDGVTNWLKQNKYKAMITEFGGSNTTQVSHVVWCTEDDVADKVYYQCASMLSDLIKYMDTNEVYIGWTAWAAGPFWGSNSACCTDSKQWGSLEPSSKAADGSPGLYETVWKKTIQPLVPKQLVWNGTSSVNGGALSPKPIRR